MRQPLPPLLLLALASAVPARGDAFDAAGLRLNQVQVIGTHNSYKAAMEPALLALLRRVAPDQADALDYSHPPLAEQLDLGLRGLEIDVFYDPDGGRYSKPRGWALLEELGQRPEPWPDAHAMRTPGFKVLHSPDFDFRSNTPTLDVALAALRAWSIAHPQSPPIVVLMNLKDTPDPVPGATTPAALDAAALDALDATVRAGLGEDRLITPDSVRRGAPTLRGAIRDRGWPPIDDCRGRFLFVMDETDAKRDRYVAGHASLAGRVFFTHSPADADEAAVFVMNDPVRHGELIRRRVAEGFLVRTRADSETREARRGDLARFAAAQRSGAQVISTDYPRADKRLGNGYCVVFEGGAYARRNPITQPVAEASVR